MGLPGSRARERQRHKPPPPATSNSSWSSAASLALPSGWRLSKRSKSTAGNTLSRGQLLTAFPTSATAFASTVDTCHLLVTARTAHTPWWIESSSRALRAAPTTSGSPLNSVSFARILSTLSGLSNLTYCPFTPSSAAAAADSEEEEDEDDCFGFLGALPPPPPPMVGGWFAPALVFFRMYDAIFSSQSWSRPCLAMNSCAVVYGLSPLLYPI
mmetsp:Transcript_20418/g.41806  ORF Transcript_20418/g.41806 Transcript_20418/m.41806 type:complete len:213 (-) Transcript_20418:1435-2073(-)